MIKPSACLPAFISPLKPVKLPASARHRFEISLGVLPRRRRNRRRPEPAAGVSPRQTRRSAIIDARGRLGPKWLSPARFRKLAAHLEAKQMFTNEREEPRGHLEPRSSHFRWGISAFPSLQRRFQRRTGGFSVRGTTHERSWATTLWGSAGDAQDASAPTRHREETPTPPSWHETQRRLG